MKSAAVFSTVWVKVLGVLGIVLMAFGCGGSGSSAGTVPPGKVLGYLPFQSSDLEGLSQDEVWQRLAAKPVRTYQDMMNLGAVLVVRGDFESASQSYLGAASVGDSDDAKAAALQASGFTFAFVSNDGVAASVVRLRNAVRLAPQSLDIAKTWYALAARSGDGAETQAAALHLSRLDPAGHPVAMDPMTGVVLIVCFLATTAITVTALTPPEDRGEVAMSVMRSLSDVAKIAVVNASGAGGAPLVGDFVARQASR